MASQHYFVTGTDPYADELDEPGDVIMFQSNIRRDLGFVAVNEAPEQSTAVYLDATGLLDLAVAALKLRGDLLGQGQEQVSYREGCHYASK